MRSLLAGLGALGGRKLAALAVVAALSLGLLATLALHGTTVPMALLYADLDLREAGQVVDQLDRAHIPHEVEAGGARILVPASQVAQARMSLAKEGLPSGGSIGYEIFDRADGLTANAFQQNLNQSRALEGELARTIRTLQGVRAARVHLVLPRREPFARDKQEAQASVVLTMAGAARLDREGVQAVVNLIAAAVPGLKPQSVSIVDSRGNLLARAGQPMSGVAAAQSADELRHGAEVRISHAVEEMLERSVGTGRVRAEASVDMDFDQIRETQEKFDPDGQVVRSQQSTNGTSKNTEAAPNVSVANNLPNAEPAASNAGSQEQKTEETTNYEIGKTVRTVVREQPQIRRLTLAVMVDGVVSPGVDGKPAWAPRPDEELARISSLVRSAVGYNEARGDKVDVVSMRFAGTDDAPEAAAPSLLAQLGRADLVHLAEAGLLAVTVVLCLSMVFRPMVLRLAMAGPSGALVAVAGPPGDMSAVAGGPNGLALPDADASMPETMMKLANVKGELRSSFVRQITQLVDNNPDASMALIRSWMQPGGRAS